MRNPYKPKPDYTRVIMWILGALALLTAVLIAVDLMRPPTSAAQHREVVLLEQEMDQAEIAAAKKERERVAALQSELE